MGRQKTKLGARILSDEELELILPDHNSIFDKIELFRENLTDGRESQKDQKTNNIGILGKRGTGKTSVLKSFYEKLVKEKEQHGDIVMPIVIPENMSSSATLMDVVLGMLKTVIDDEIQKTKQNRYEDCIYEGNTLQGRYNQLITQYCYIKEDYRNVLVQQFTTEQYYVDKTKKVFNCDTEFINHFDKFMKDLFPKERPNGLLFLFIDDIDLSTTRCMDVVKTLLTYLSHPRIVTFLSGDMETFREALTLDFLRQEKALSQEVFQKGYIDHAIKDKMEPEDLLARKKILAYEYLKKILPPAYRYFIRYWTLEMRGQYAVTDEDGKLQTNLCDNLVQATSGIIPEGYFKLPVVYHMFDDTSRGLNNVYNVLQGMNQTEDREFDSDIGQNAQEKMSRAHREALLRTIVASKPFYDQYGDELFRKIIQVGVETKVDFTNANRLIYPESGHQFLPVQRFAFFILFDFAARLLMGGMPEEEDYQTLKRRVIEDYINHEEVDERIAVEGNKIIKEGYLGEKFLPVMLGVFLQKGDIILSLYLVRYLKRETIGQIISGELKTPQADYQLAHALAMAVRDIAGEVGRKDYLVSLYDILGEQLVELMSRLPADSMLIYMQNMCVEDRIAFWRIGLSGEGKVWHTYQEKILEYGKFSDFPNKEDSWRLVHYLMKRLPYILYCETEVEGCGMDWKHTADQLVRNGIALLLNEELQPLMNQYQIKPLSAGDYNFKKNSGEKGNEESHQREVICAVDKKGLWKEKYVHDQIKKYLKAQVENYNSALQNTRVIFDGSCLKKGQGDYQALQKCAVGSSGSALIIGVKEKLNLLFGDLQDNKYGDSYYMGLEHILAGIYVLESFLRNHPRAYYGKQEARKLVRKLRELPLKPKYDREEWEGIQERIEERAESFRERIESSVQNKLGEAQPDPWNKWYNESAENANGKDWNNIEKELQEENLKFAVHSYLRYLQETGQDLNAQGELAEAVVELADDLIEAEILSDKKVVMDFYELIREEIHLSDEEFEKMHWWV